MRLSFNNLKKSLDFYFCIQFQLFLAYLFQRPPSLITIRLHWCIAGCISFKFKKHYAYSISLLSRPRPLTTWPQLSEWPDLLVVDGSLAMPTGAWPSPGRAACQREDADTALAALGRQWGKFAYSIRYCFGRDVSAVMPPLSRIHGACERKRSTAHKYWPCIS